MSDTVSRVKTVNVETRPDQRALAVIQPSIATDIPALSLSHIQEPGGRWHVLYFAAPGVAEVKSMSFECTRNKQLLQITAAVAALPAGVQFLNAATTAAFNAAQRRRA